MAYDEDLATRAVGEAGRRLRAVAAAEAATIVVQKTYEAPNRSLRQLNIFSATGDSDPLLAFSEACRKELRTLKPSTMFV